MLRAPHSYPGATAQQPFQDPIKFQITNSKSQDPIKVQIPNSMLRPAHPHPSAILRLRSARRSSATISRAKKNRKSKIENRKLLIVNHIELLVLTNYNLRIIGSNKCVINSPPIKNPIVANKEGN